MDREEEEGADLPADEAAAAASVSAALPAPDDGMEEDLTPADSVAAPAAEEGVRLRCMCCDSSCVLLQMKCCCANAWRVAKRLYLSWKRE